MKNFNSLRPVLIAIGLAVTLAGRPQSVVAENQPPGPSSKTPPGVVEKNPPTPVGPGKSGFDFEIRGGQLVNSPNGRVSEATLGNAVDALRDRYTTVNIVVAPGLAEVELTDLKLRAGQLADELEAIRVASGFKFDWVGPGSAGPNLPPGSGAQTVDPATGLLTATASAASNTGLFILRAPAPTAETVRTVEAFNIGPYLQWLREQQAPKEMPERREEIVAKSLDELEQIVLLTLQGLKPGGAVEMPSIRFHRGANLLIVTGTSEAVEVARKVVNALPGQAVQAAGAASPFGGSVLSPALAKRYGLLPPTAPSAPAPPR